MLKILLLEDDPIIADIIIDYCQDNTYEIDYAFDIIEAKSFVMLNIYDIFIFDVMVPNGNGFELLKDIRSTGISTPTIFISALNSIDDVKNGFHSGGDDYIKKPFELNELKLRIQNIKRLYKLDDFIELDKNIRLNKQKFILEVNEVQFNISNKELNILEYLCNNDKLVSKEELITNIWENEASPLDSTIRSHIKNLRQIIGKEKITNTKGFGYRFIKE